MTGDDRLIRPEYDGLVFITGQQTATGRVPRTCYHRITAHTHKHQLLLVFCFTYMIFTIFPWSGQKVSNLTNLAYKFRQQQLMESY